MVLPDRTPEWRITALRLFDLERGGLLDQTRMCGHPPMATLAAFAAASAAPYLLSASVLMALYLSTHAAAQPAALAVLVLLGSLVLSLIAYGTLPVAGLLALPCADPHRTA